MKPRQPTSQEQKELVLLEALRRGDTPEEVAMLYKDAAIVVFDSYATSTPGYRGKVMIVRWNSDPARHDTYIWQNGTITKCLPLL